MLPPIAIAVSWSDWTNKRLVDIDIRRSLNAPSGRVHPRQELNEATNRTSERNQANLIDFTPMIPVALGTIHRERMCVLLGQKSTKHPKR